MQALAASKRVGFSDECMEEPLDSVILFSSSGPPIEPTVARQKYYNNVFLYAFCYLHDIGKNPTMG